jgi:hypothetical protein
MRRCLSTAGLLLAVLLMVSGNARAADPPYVGTWKVIVYQGTSEASIFLLKIEEKAAGPKIELVDALPNFKTAKVEASTPDGTALKISSEGGLSMKFAFYPPKGEKEPKTMLGSVELRGSTDFACLERTEDKEVAPRGTFKPIPGSEDLLKALRMTDAKEKETALREFVEKNSGSLLGFRAAVELMVVMSNADASDKDLKAAGERAINIAGAYGPEMKTGAVKQVTIRLSASRADKVVKLAIDRAKDEEIKAAGDKAIALAGSFNPESRGSTESMIAQGLIAMKKAPNMAVEFARLAEKDLAKDATVQQQMAAAKMLLAALKLAEKSDEIKVVNERIAKLDKLLDDEFLKTAVPFKTKAFERSGKSERVSLVELFTGAQCPPCVAADVAFDAALKTFQPNDVILLQYHLHIPGPDALTNADTETRWKYYAGRGVPSTYVNGGNDLGLGGPKDAGKNSFDRLAEAVKSPLGDEAKAKIKLTAKQTGSDSDNLVITAEVADLKDAGADVKLRLVLVEEMVRYPGNNGQRFHHHVVRMMPGGVEGFELKEASAKQEVMVNLADLRKTLGEYLVEANKRRPFFIENRPLDLKHLKVVAFIQNDKTKEVLQAAQVDVDAAK